MRQASFFLNMATSKKLATLSNQIFPQMLEFSWDDLRPKSQAGCLPFRLVPSRTSAKPARLNNFRTNLYQPRTKEIMHFVASVHPFVRAA